MRELCTARVNWFATQIILDNSFIETWFKFNFGSRVKSRMRRGQWRVLESNCHRDSGLETRLEGLKRKLRTKIKARIVEKSSSSGVLNKTLLDF